MSDSVRWNETVLVVFLICNLNGTFKSKVTPGLLTWAEVNVIKSGDSEWVAEDAIGMTLECVQDCV